MSTSPIPPIELPDIPPGPLLVAALDTSLPLTMFPVRLATRFHRPRPGAKPTELWVRIFPDLLHADGHLPELSAEEIIIGRTYWEKLWRAGGDPTARTDVHNWAVAQLGAPRMAWLAQRIAPTNPQDAPRRPVPVDKTLIPAPRFPEIKSRTDTRPTVARLLPDRWCVIMRRSVEFVERVWSSPVRRDLAMAPNLTDMPADGGAREMLQNQDLWWMVDFDEAVAAGMAVKVPWDKSIQPKHVTELVVFGIRNSANNDSTELEQLLDAHCFTEGLEFVSQGTPTNNTDFVSAGFTETPNDLEAYFKRQLADLTARRPSLKPASRLGTITAANATSISLGLTAVNAFDHAEYADLRYGSWTRDMNRSLWPATFGYFFSRILATDGKAPLADTDIGWLQSWFRDWVRGPGFLPTIRVGTQPYGFLPVARRPGWDDKLGGSQIDRLLSVLFDLEEWENSSVPHFSHLESEPPPTPEEEAARLAAVLGAVPHPTAFRLRHADDHFQSIATEWDEQIAEMERLLYTTHNDLWREEYELDWRDEILDGTIADQAYGLERLRTRADDMAVQTQYENHWDEIAATRDHIDEMLRPMTLAHKMRSETRKWEGQFSEAHMPTAEDPPLWYIEYGDDGAADDGSFPDLQLVPDNHDLTITVATFRSLAAAARDAASFPRPRFDHSRPASLLEKLVHHSIENVASSATEELALGLEGLADMLESQKVDKPLADLERLLRETLGLATHRYDAWVTSVATQRLATLRANKPQGYQVGAYGWLVNLSPDEDGSADTQGFIHAPSLDHAATAAVLRSAWMAYSSDALDAPFGVDLSSNRVRRATWLLEGVRNGVDLAELLGARFERRLHDSGLSHLIADIRVLVQAAAGHADRPDHAIVDGLAITTAYSESTVDDPLHDNIEEFRKKLPGDEGKRLLVQLEDSVADMDSTADLLTTQAVHSVIKGNLPEAAATLSVAGAGDSGIPQLRVPSVHRESQVINHRIVAVLPAVTSPPNSPSLLTLAEPALAAWVESLLPDLGIVAVAIEFGNGGADGQWETRVANTGLSAIEVLALASVSGNLDSSRLGALLGARARFETGVPTNIAATFVDVNGRGMIPLSDLGVAVGALRNAVGSARPLRGNDLSDSAEVDQHVDVEELDARRIALADALTDLGSKTVDELLLTERLADLAAVDLEGLVAALSFPESRTEHLEALLSRAADVARNLYEPLPKDYPKLDPQAQADYLTELISNALSLKIPILAQHTPGNRAGLATAFGASRKLLGSPLRAMSWLLEVGRIHIGAGQCSEALDLIESLNPATPAILQTAQLPHVPGEPWVAVNAPVGQGSRLHLFSVSNAKAALEEGPIAGLIFDGWSEPIPGNKATTGVAIHFDQPSAQPPQAVLLAMPPNKGIWTIDEIETMLVQTLQLAQIRAVGPETLFSWGHTLPAVYLADDVEVAVIDDEEEAT